MYQILQYIKFLRQSTNQHGVHSPFVFDLVTKCFYDKTDYQDYKKLKFYRDKLLKNNQNMQVSDFGSGSRVFNSDERKVSKIARNSGTPLKRMKLLYRLVDYFKPNKSLELGTSLGSATSAMALGNPNNQITSIEGCSNTLELARKQLQSLHIDHVELINNKFESAVPTLANQTFDFIFFDGHHSKKATLSYFEELLRTAHNDSIFIFDDIYWSKEMTEAWQTIKKHPRVTVSVDIFFWGLVFFRKEQAEEHFKIRM